MTAVVGYAYSLFGGPRPAFWSAMSAFAARTFAALGAEGILGARGKNGRIGKDEDAEVQRDACRGGRADGQARVLTDCSVLLQSGVYGLDSKVYWPPHRQPPRDNPPRSTPTKPPSPLHILSPSKIPRASSLRHQLTPSFPGYSNRSILPGFISTLYPASVGVV